jgi:hypothetical protein
MALAAGLLATAMALLLLVRVRPAVAAVVPGWPMALLLQVRARLPPASAAEVPVTPWQRVMVTPPRAVVAGVTVTQQQQQARVLLLLVLATPAAVGRGPLAVRAAWPEGVVTALQHQAWVMAGPAARAKPQLPVVTAAAGLAAAHVAAAPAAARGVPAPAAGDALLVPLAAAALPVLPAAAAAGWHRSGRWGGHVSTQTPKGIPEQNTK